MSEYRLLFYTTGFGVGIEFGIINTPGYGICFLLYFILFEICIRGDKK